MSFESETVKWWRKKKKGKRDNLTKKIDGTWIKELVGDSRINEKKLKAWEWPPQIGMDKIRATTNIGKYFVEFASTSTFHGINHLTAPHRHPFERFLVILFIGGALATAILLSLYFWERYQNDATILVIDHRYRDKKFTVTTPSLLACPLEKINEQLFTQVFQRHEIKDTTEARDFFAFIANATYDTLKDTPIYTQVSPDKWLTILWELRSNVSVFVFPYELDIENSKQWVITEEGFCLMLFSYVSLYMSYNYWIENNWTIVQPPTVLPSLTFFNREDVRGVTSENHAVKASVHYPLEVPELEDAGIVMFRSQITDLYFSPQETITSDDAKRLSSAQRKCKIPEERGLRMWPIYTHNMCILECKYELIRKVCGCYPHFARPMPEIPVCTARQLRCVGENSNKFVKISHATEMECGCLFSCDTSIYIPTEYKISNAKKGSPNFTIVKTHLVFPHNKIRRELLFGFNDYLAAVGGAGGLFLGASVLSFMEIIYFVAIHLFWYKMKLRREKKAQLERGQRIKMFFSKNSDKMKEKLKY